MADGKMSHDWDLCSALICYTVNIQLPIGKGIGIKDVHPFLAKKKQKVKPFNRNDWLSLKKKIKKR
jgi:hypothetical protein